MREVARRAAEAVKVHDRDAHEHASEALEVEAFEDPPHDLGAVELIAVDSGGETQRRPRLRPSAHQDRCAERVAREGFAHVQR
jgi:hypothetical protein